jgi:hypothetical protein
MAFELNNRTKIIAGVVVLALAGAGAGWYFFLQDTAPAPRATTPAKPATKPAAQAAKGPADAPKAGAPAAKPAPAAVAKPAAKPIPTNPDQLVAQIIETSGAKAQIRNFAREVGRSAGQASQSDGQEMSEADAKAIYEIAGRTFEPEKMTAEVATSLKTAYDAVRMGRLLEILRQPLALKMAAMETRQTPPEETARLLEDVQKKPPPAARQKLIQALDEIAQSSETGVQLATLTARETVDATLNELQKAGKPVPKQARQVMGSQIVASQGAMRSGFRNMLLITYRDASDAELAEYVKLLDTDTGRWGLELLAGAQRSVIESRVRGFAREVAQRAVRQALAKGPSAKPAAPVEEEKPAEKLPVAAAPAAPVEAPGYRRPAGIRDVYTRYNDLISATVMRDSAAVKELLDDGKSPNVRQSDSLTPLMIAAANGDIGIAAMLLAKGADPNLRTQGGRTALSLAKARGAAGAQTVQLLQRSGARE